MSIDMSAAGNLNAAFGMGGTSGLGGSLGMPASPNWSSAQMGAATAGRQYAGQLHPGTGAGAGSSSSTYSSGGGGVGWNQAGINALLQQQMAENNATKAANEGRWQAGVNMLTGARDSYNNSAITAGNRNLVSGLQADPYTINDNTQALIQNKAAGTINANLNSQADRMAGILAAGGQTDAGSMAAMQSQLGRQGIGQLANTQSQIEVQRALQNKQDIMNAIQAGQTQAGQDYGVNAGTANSYLQNNLYEKPMDLSGYIAALGPMGVGGGGGAATSTASTGPFASTAANSQYANNPFANRVGGGATQSGNYDLGLGMAWGNPGQRSTLNGSQAFNWGATPGGGGGAPPSALGAPGWGAPSGGGNSSSFSWMPND